MTNDYPQAWQDRASELYPEWPDNNLKVDPTILHEIQQEAYLRGLSESKVLMEALGLVGELVESAGYNLPYSKLKDDVKKDFKKWVGEVKQQDWIAEDGWYKAWFNYEREFIHHIATKALSTFPNAEQKSK